ncbi:HAD-IC family P-type ATPase [bacterium]|nr:HAD-IC family P-type ATPase [bacterium]
MSSRQIQNVAAESVYQTLHSRAAGLTVTEVAERLRELGPNVLRAEKPLRWVATLARQFLNFFSLLLDLSAIVCFIANHVQPGEGMLLMGWALLGVSVLNAGFSFVQEYRAELAMQALQKFLPPKVTVRRDGRDQEMLADQIVSGDVLLLHEGNRIPADARLVEAHDLLVSNAPLTGEARSVPLSPDATDTALIDSTNITFAGCQVVRGSATAVVFATGARTEFGRIASLSRDIARPATPLELETRRMVRILTVIAVTMGVLFFAYGVAAGRPLWVNLVFMLGIIVANVPEGLLPTFTLALSMGSLRLARRNVLVKSLPAVEALGAVHVICTDKTGTLTLNQLQITQFVDPLTGEPLSSDVDEPLCLKIALIASDVDLRSSGEPATFSGDPLDVALAEAFAGRGGQPVEIVRQTNRHFAFDAVKRREAGLYQAGPEGSREVIFAVKGAWESLRPLIRFVERSVPDGEATTTSVEEDVLAAADETVHRLASQGARVIAVAYRRPQETASNASQERLEQNLILKAFLCFDDPLRPEVPEAVARCQSAGIRVFMVTGDHPDTAEAVARRAGILAEDCSSEAGVITGAELHRLRESHLVERLEGGLAVFARTSPEQKMKIISAVKRQGLVVGMTGDGVNDAPALKAADIGIAMGRGGTDVAREAAGMVLLDDNFASIVAGVEEGRTIFENIRRFTNYVLVSNVPEIVPYLVYIVLPVPLALNILQILSIDLGTDIIPAMGLGQEPPGRDTMRQPPRGPADRLLSLPLLLHSYLFLGMFEAAYALLLFFLVLIEGGWQYGQELASSNPLVRSASGAALATIILMQIGNLAGRRSTLGSGLDAGLFRNRLILLGVLFEIAFSWAILNVEPLQRVLGTGPVDWHIYALAWLGVPLIYGVDYLNRLRQAHRQRTHATTLESTVEP